MRDQPALCQVCGTALTARPTVTCARCATQHHRDCWDYNQVCSTYGCGCRRVVEAPGPPHRPPGDLFAPASVAAALVAVVAWVSFSPLPLPQTRNRIHASPPPLEARPAVAARPVAPRVNSLDMVLAWIPPGRFMMGRRSYEEGEARYEEPLHEVQLTLGFWMGTTEVTQGEWGAVMDSNPSTFVGSRLPVVNVSWDECQEFCRRLTAREQPLGTLPEGSVYRLPTEAEWEHACRAGTDGVRYGNLYEIAWCNGNSGGQTHEGRLKRANPWGLYDMLGNVNEWCQDRHRSFSSAALVDPVGPVEGRRALRGGSVYSSPESCRPAFLEDADRHYRHFDRGCRVVLGAPAGNQ